MTRSTPTEVGAGSFKGLDLDFIDQSHNNLDYLSDAPPRSFKTVSVSHEISPLRFVYRYPMRSGRSGEIDSERGQLGLLES